jgi:hypothetical protein
LAEDFLVVIAADADTVERADNRATLETLSRNFTITRPGR